MSRFPFRAATVAAPLLAFVIAAAPAAADVGVGISANPVSLTGAGRAGRTYHLSPVRVVNSGTEASSYHVFVASLGETSAPYSVPPSWVRATPNDFTLQPTQAATVSLTLVIPKGAHRGNYASGIKASAVQQRTGQVSFGATAATKLVFSVAGTPPLASRVVGSTWVRGGLVVAGAALVLLLIARLFGVSVEVARRLPVADGLAAIEQGRTAIADLELRRQEFDGLARRARSVGGCEFIAASSGL